MSFEVRGRSIRCSEYQYSAPMAVRAAMAEGVRSSARKQKSTEVFLAFSYASTRSRVLSSSKEKWPLRRFFGSTNTQHSQGPSWGKKRKDMAAKDP